jgi:hypothetical protein
MPRVAKEAMCLLNELAADQMFVIDQDYFRAALPCLYSRSQPGGAATDNDDIDFLRHPNAIVSRKRFFRWKPT